jgi:hypothetical protein
MASESRIRVRIQESVHARPVLLSGNESRHLGVATSDVGDTPEFVPIRERDQVSGGLLLRSDRRLPGRADRANDIRAIDLRSVFGGASVARSSPLASCSNSAPGAPAARMPGGCGQRRPRWALHRSWLVARARSGSPRTWASLSFLCNARGRVWRYSRLARTASARSRRNSTSRSPSCGRRSCARQQSTYRRASRPVSGTPI